MADSEDERPRSDPAERQGYPTSTAPVVGTGDTVDILLDGAHHEGKRYRVRIVGREDGPQITELSITSTTPITTADLRRIPLRRLASAAMEEISEGRVPPLPHELAPPLGRDPDTGLPAENPANYTPQMRAWLAARDAETKGAAQAMSLDAWLREGGTAEEWREMKLFYGLDDQDDEERRPGRPRLRDEHLVEVAVRARQARAAGKPVTKTLREQYRRGESTIFRWLDAARERGYLEPDEFTRPTAPKSPPLSKRMKGHQD